jgi:membrane associated rhomboid family serine protease
MFPFKDENPAELTPLITVGLIMANLAAWVFVQGLGSNLQASVCEFGLIPVELTGQSVEGLEVCRLGGMTWGTMVSSMFMHGGWLHLLSNMMFLWVFGNNIEDSMGHFRFAVFYLICGLVAASGHVFLNGHSALPTVGASGAISGVLGAYILLYPNVRVHVFFPPIWVFPMRASIVLGYWILIQILMGIGHLSGAPAGGVAVWAHIGGFFAGLVLVKFFERPQLVTAKREHRRLDRQEIRSGRYWW